MGVFSQLATQVANVCRQIWLVAKGDGCKKVIYTLAEISSWDSLQCWNVTHWSKHFSSTIFCDKSIIFWSDRFDSGKMRRTPKPNANRPTVDWPTKLFLPDVGNWIDSGDESGDEIKHLMPKCMPCWQGLAKLFHCQKIIMPQDHKSGTLILWSNGFVGHVFKSRFTTIGCFFFCTRKRTTKF